MTAHGGPAVLKPIEEDIPEPGPGEVRVRILATGVAFADVLMRYGLYPNTPPVPFSPGYDIVGTIDRVGAGVAGPALGDTVAALTMFGGYSQFINLRASELTRVPAGLDPSEAVSLVLNYVTAWQMIHRIAKLQPGQSVLIHGAGGGVGTAALQLGKLAGLDMYATASRAKHDMVTALGGKPIDYKKQDFVSRILQMTDGQGVDAALDPVGGTNWWRSYKLLRMNRGKPAGKLIGYGISDTIVSGKPSKLTGAASFALLGLLNFLPDGKSVRWYNISSEKKRHPELFREDLAHLFQLLLEKKIHPLVSERLPLREAPRAHGLIENARVPGKVVLLCQE
jgi:NADPH2:quinone reductase